MTGFLLTVLVGGGLIWMLWPRTLGVKSGQSSNSGWWGFPGMGSGPGGTGYSSHSTDCSPGDGGGGSCGGGDGG